MGGILLVRVGGFQTRGLVGVNDLHVASSDPRRLAALQTRCIYYRTERSMTFHFGVPRSISPKWTNDLCQNQLAKRAPAAGLLPASQNS